MMEIKMVSRGDNTKYHESVADTLGTNITRQPNPASLCIKSFLILYPTTNQLQSPTCDNV